MAGGLAESMPVRVTVVTLVIYILIKLFQWGVEERKIQALGGRAKRIPSYLPFGVDVIFRTIYAATRYRDLDVWTAWFRGAPDASTAEVTLAGLRCVFTVNPENIKAILAAQFSDYGKGQRFHDDWEEFLGDSIFTTDGDRWQHNRRLIRPQFVTERVSDLQVFERHVQRLITLIVNNKDTNDSYTVPGEKNDLRGMNAIDANDLFLRFTLDVATEFLLGTSVNSLKSPQHDFAKAFAEVQRIQNFITRAGPANVIIPRSSYNAGVKTIEKFISPFIEEALSFSPEELAARMESKYTFLQALASTTQDRKVLRDQIVAILLAGRDTTAAALSWTMYELARHPEVFRKLRAEIIDTVGLENPPTYRNLKDMKYLQSTINETLRLYPSVPFNLRIALCDTTLPRGGGLSGGLPVGVLKDTIVGYSVLAMQRREDLYPAHSQPLVFDPDRWLSWQPKPWCYIPFNGGPRICIGQQFALTEAGYTIVRLLQRFDSLDGFDDPNRPCLKSEVVLQPAYGVNVAFTGKANSKQK